MLGSFRRPTFRIFAGVIAVISIVTGICLSFFHSRGFEETTAEIVALEAGEDAAAREVSPGKAEIRACGEEIKKLPVPTVPGVFFV